MAATYTILTYLWSIQCLASTSVNCFIFLPFSAMANATLTTSWWFWGKYSIIHLILQILMCMVISLKKSWYNFGCTCNSVISIPYTQCHVCVIKIETVNKVH